VADGSCATCSTRTSRAVHGGLFHYDAESHGDADRTVAALSHLLSGKRRIYTSPKCASARIRRHDRQDAGRFAAYFAVMCRGCVLSPDPDLSYAKNFMTMLCVEAETAEL